MHILHFVSATVFVSAVLATDAPVITDNVPGAWAIANTPGGGDKDILAQISVASVKDGGVAVTLNINGGPQLSGGPFMYHIHEKAVPSDGNCTGTGAHLDPTGRGETPACDATNPKSCQVGDLSGKHTTCATIPGCSKNFTDQYLSLTPGNAAFIGDKSIVIHYANKTRIACANFVMGTNGSGGNNNNVTSSGTPTASSFSGIATAPSTSSSSAAGTSSTAPSSANSMRHIGTTGILALIATIGFSVL